MAGTTETAAIAAAPRARRPLLGVAAMIGAGVCMLSSDAVLKLASRELPLGEMILGRGATTFLLLGLAAIAAGQVCHPTRLVSLPVAVRIMGEIGAALCFNAALMRMPIANAAAVLQFIPLVTVAVAARLFGERVGWQRLVAGAVGLAGVMAILRPGPEGFNWWSLLAVAAMLSMSIRDLATSRIDRSLPTLMIAAVTAGVAGLSGLFLAPLEAWVLPSLKASGLVVGAGVLMAAGFTCLVVAVRNADMSLLAPFRYATVLWAIVLGYFAWAEMPDLVALSGIALVVGAGLVTFWRERRILAAAAARR